MTQESRVSRRTETRTTHRSIKQFLPALGHDILDRCYTSLRGWQPKLSREMKYLSWWKSNEVYPQRVINCVALSTMSFWFLCLSTKYHWALISPHNGSRVASTPSYLSVSHEQSMLERLEPGGVPRAEYPRALVSARLEHARA